ncbi:MULTISPECIES: FKBP-type peptidyl-prolyl cis-trans isomerase [Candidatus Ichthyocystis]|uniref:FKBP-type peptidyl-prolyl cis-trans isomerase n=1 Tax=Candidatus Ichthyocystis TaxID=2929841 RepID=UPI000B825697|nr:MULTISPECIES: FKBP-type peptidyl-prolyl cis-trans isomerase [Ichthyocystis]
MKVIDYGSLVTLFYQIKVDRTAEIVLDNFSSTPATLKIGEGTLNSFFEDCLIGLSSGDRREFFLSPGESFGFRRDDLLKTVKKSFIAKNDIDKCRLVSIKNKGLSVTGVIVEFNDDSVLVDFNHPLSGENIKFYVHIVDVL